MWGLFLKIHASSVFVCMHTCVFFIPKKGQCEMWLTCDKDLDLLSKQYLTHFSWQAEQYETWPRRIG